jgi:hypothetical protein
VVTQERAELEPLPSIFSKLPTASDLKKQVMAAIDGGYAQLVEARGEVTRPEDTYEVQRRLAGAEETLKEFEQAFAAGRKVINSYQKEEFELALGGREVAPRESMNIPDAEGDLRVAADTSNTYTIDTEALISACSASVIGTGAPGTSLDSWVTDVVNGDTDPFVDPDTLPDILAEALSLGMRALIACGKFDPQVTKVRAYADTLARSGDDHLAATVNSAIGKTVKLKGVKVERKAQK